MMSRGGQATGREEVAGGAASSAKAGRREEEKGSSRVSVSENSRNGAAGRLGTARAIFALEEAAAQRGGRCWEPLPCPPPASFLGLGSFSASRVTPASVS